MSTPTATKRDEGLLEDVVGTVRTRPLLDVAVRVEARALGRLIRRPLQPLVSRRASFGLRSRRAARCRAAAPSARAARR